MNSSLAVPTTLVVIAMACIQLGAAIAKQLFPVVGPQGTTTLRLVFAAVILCVVWRPWRTVLKASELRSVLIYGLSIGGMTLFISAAIERIPLGIAVTLEFMGPVAVALLASKRPLDFIWILLAAIGILLLLPVSDLSEPLDLLGIAYALGAGFCWFLYIIYGQKSGSSSHGGTVVAVGMSIASMLALPFGVTQAGTKLFAVGVLPMGLAVAVLSSVIPYSLEMISLQKMPAKNFSILMSLEPAFAAVFGFLVLHEHLAWIQCSAIACVILASVGSTASARETGLTVD